MTIEAVVVTYNRKDLLLECLKAIFYQSYPVSSVTLIDNHSTDGTKDSLEAAGILSNPIMNYLYMDSNLGGSGGFYEGMKIARERGADYVWIMDDDTIPGRDCLKKLVGKLEVLKTGGIDNVSFLASAVYGEAGEVMNVPTVSNRKSPNGYQDWYRFLDDKMISISKATFVSLLISRGAMQRCGLPCKDYFIWGDDSEYTTRITKYYGPAYLVGDSIAIHKRKSAKVLKIDDETEKERIEMYHYAYRNTAINMKYYRETNHEIFRIQSVGKAILCLGQNYGWDKFKAIIKGIWESHVQYGRFKKYIDEQLGGE